jgi:hypothetical protein
VNIGTRADEILRILNSIIGPGYLRPRYLLGEAVVYLVSPPPTLSSTPSFSRRRQKKEKRLRSYLSRWSFSWGIFAE